MGLHRCSQKTGQRSRSWKQVWARLMYEDIWETLAEELALRPNLEKMSISYWKDCGRTLWADRKEGRNVLIKTANPGTCLLNPSPF